MEHRFDTLAKALAGSISRREALSRLGGGAGGLLLAALGMGTAWSAPAPNSPCEDFCRACPGVSPGSGFGECVSSCEACVNRTNGLPCGCPASPGEAVVCTNCCLPDQSTGCTTDAQCCSGQCNEGVCCLRNESPCGSSQQCCGSVICAGGTCGAGG